MLLLNRHKRTSHHRSPAAFTIAALVAALVATVLGQPGAGPAGAQQAQPAALTWSVGAVCLDEIVPVSMGWASGQAPRPAWVARRARPERLFDGAGTRIRTQWAYFSNSAVGPADWIRLDFAADVDLTALSINNGPNVAGSWIALSLDQRTSIAAPLDWDAIPSRRWATSPFVHRTRSVWVLAGHGVKINELRFCGRVADGGGGGGGGGGSGPCGPNHHPADRFCGSVHIIDSFGDADLPVPIGQAGPQWEAVIAYHNENPGLPGQCSMTVHARYWVLVDVHGQPPGSVDVDGDGDFEAYYPTGHTAVDQETGCFFGHEHGATEPHTSDLYDEDSPAAIGVPFGYLHAQHGNHTGRKEDHVGHKVVVQNNWTPVWGNPFNQSTQLTPTGMTCDWLSKIHQGSHGSDALAENVHEYFLNVECDGSGPTRPTHVRIKELATWGTRNRVFIEEQAESGLQCATASNWIDETNPGDPYAHLINFSPPASHAAEFRWILTGFTASAGVDVTQWTPNNDGKREFSCVYARLAAGWTQNPQGLQEVWKPDGDIALPGGGSLKFSPYYITRNPARYVDPMWRTSNATFDNNAMFTTVDLCVKGTRAYDRIAAAHSTIPEHLPYPVFCNVLDRSLQQQWEREVAARGGDSAALSLARRTHPANPFNGTDRALHPKSIQIYGGATPNSRVTTGQNRDLDILVFCTDPMGDNPRVADRGANGAFSCGMYGTLQQVSVASNNWVGIDGSTVGQIPNGASFTAAGPGREWVIDMTNAVGVHHPN